MPQLYSAIMAACDERPVTENSSLKIISGKNGEIIFNREKVLGKGGYGCVFVGQFSPNDGPLAPVDVAVKRIEKMRAKNNFEEIIMERIDSHPNVLHYYCVEEDDDFM